VEKNKINQRNLLKTAFSKSTLTDATSAGIALKWQVKYIWDKATAKKGASENDNWGGG
jgi:hypothetical protein